MTVDISKIQIGDIVHVAVTFDGAYRDLLRMKTRTDCFTVDSSAVVAHIPAPRPLKVGDLVTWQAVLSDGSGHYTHLGTIRAIDNGYAWAGVDTVLPLECFTRKE